MCVYKKPQSDTRKAFECLRTCVYKKPQSEAGKQRLREPQPGVPREKVYQKIEMCSPPTVKLGKVHCLNYADLLCFQRKR